MGPLRCTSIEGGVFHDFFALERSVYCSLPLTTVCRKEKSKRGAIKYRAVAKGVTVMFIPAIRCYQPAFRRDAGYSL